MNTEKVKFAKPNSSKFIFLNMSLTPHRAQKKTPQNTNKIEHYDNQ